MNQPDPIPDAPVILISALGTGNYGPSRYRFGDTFSREETYFSVALGEYVRPDLFLSLQTNEAARKHGEELAKAWRATGIEMRAVAIPDGASEKELWEIFRIMAAEVPERARVHLDITHGFRSLPMLGFIALSYLRVTREIEIGEIRYGAWEAREPESGATPAFDLTPFVTLLDWTAAADQFLRTGSAARISSLLVDTQQNLWKSSDGQDRDALPRNLKSLATALEIASENLLMLRTSGMADAAARLESILAEARTEAEAHVLPFLEVLQPIEEDLTRFSSADLTVLRDLVEWLAERDQVAAAFTLASEWLVSYLMVALGHGDHHADHKTRAPYAEALNVLEDPAKAASAGNEDRTLAETARSTLSDDVIYSLRRVSSQIRSARNDLNHAGFNDHPASAATLSKRAKEVASELARLPLPS